MRYINTYGWQLDKPADAEKLVEQLKIWLGLTEGEMVQTAWTPPEKTSPPEAILEESEESEESGTLKDLSPTLGQNRGIGEKRGIGDTERSFTHPRAESGNRGKEGH